MKKMYTRMLVGAILFCFISLSAQIENPQVKNNFSPVSKIEFLSKKISGKELAEIRENTVPNKMKRIEDLLKKLMVQIWDSDNDKWKDTLKTDYKYDGDNLIEEKTQFYNEENSEWVDYVKIAIKYNGKDMVTEIFTRMWDTLDKKWIDYDKQIIEYDDSDTLIKKVTFQENFAYIYPDIPGAPTGLSDLQIQVFSYNDNQTVKQKVVDGAFPLDTIFEIEKYLKIKYDYNNDKKVTEELWQVYVGVTYMDRLKINSEYDGDLLVKQKESWNETGDWDNLRQYTYTYTDFDSLETGLREEWDTTANQFVNYTRATLEYNSDKLITSNLLELWSGTDWGPYDKLEFKYKDKLMSERIYKFYLLGQWVKLERALYEYNTSITKPQGFLSANGLISDFSTEYFAGTILMKFAVKQTARFYLDIYDLQGKRIITLLNGEKISQGMSKSIRWDQTDGNGLSVAAGTYVLRLNCGNMHSLTNQLILNRQGESLVI